jgi:hypothetical protein
MDLLQSVLPNNLDLQNDSFQKEIDLPKELLFNDEIDFDPPHQTRHSSVKEIETLAEEQMPEKNSKFQTYAVYQSYELNIKLIKLEIQCSKTSKYKIMLRSDETLPQKIKFQSKRYKIEAPENQPADRFFNAEFEFVPEEKLREVISFRKLSALEEKADLSSSPYDAFTMTIDILQDT